MGHCLRPGPIKDSKRRTEMAIAEQEVDGCELRVDVTDSQLETERESRE